MITITHCTDTQSLINEVKEKYPDYVSEDGDFMITKKFKSFRKNNETLNRINVSDEEFKMIQSLDNIALITQAKGQIFLYNNSGLIVKLIVDAKNKKIITVVLFHSNAR